MFLLTNSVVKDASTEAQILITVAPAVGVAVQTNRAQRDGRQSTVTNC